MVSKNLPLIGFISVIAIVMVSSLVISLVKTKSLESNTTDVINIQKSFLSADFSASTDSNINKTRRSIAPTKYQTVRHSDSDTVRQLLIIYH